MTLSFGKGSFSVVKECFYLEFIFFNNTGNKVQISNARIADVTPLLRVHRLADKDKTGNFHPLKFIDERGGYNIRHVIIETNSQAKTGVPLAEDYTESEVRALIETLNSLPKNNKEVIYFVLKFIVALRLDKAKEKEYKY